MAMPSILAENAPSRVPSCRASASDAEPSPSVAESPRMLSVHYTDDGGQLKHGDAGSNGDGDEPCKAADVQEIAQDERKHGFFSTELAPERREYVAIMLRPVCMVVLLMWLCLPVFWGAYANAPSYTSNLEAWFINRDASRIGNTLWQSFSNFSASPMHLGWVNIDPAVAGSDAEIGNAVVQNKAWIAVIVEANATLNLAHARSSGNASYDPRSAMTVYYSQARQEIAVGMYLLPIVNQLLTSTVTAYSTGSAQRYFAQIMPDGVVNQTAVQLLAQAPQTINPGVSYRMIDLRPFSDPTSQAVTLVGNIFLVIFAFIATIAHAAARAVIAPRLAYRSYLALRIAVPLLVYLPLSMSYALVSVAYNLPFNGKYTYGAGFMLAFVYFYLGMAALGLALEAMVTVLTVRFIPYFLFILIIFNVAPTLLPPELMHPFYNYGTGFPILNLSLALRTILFDTHSTLGRNAGVMLAWIGLSCATILGFSRLMRRRELAGLASMHVHRPQHPPPAAGPLFPFFAGRRDEREGEINTAKATGKAKAKHVDDAVEAEKM